MPPQSRKKALPGRSHQLVPDMPGKDVLPGQRLNRQNAEVQQFFKGLIILNCNVVNASALGYLPLNEFGELLNIDREFPA